uniref:Uncharacterized protein n=1 Tax=Strongyloides venezuelensis TaxID=75913 RepID=A0A0K0FCW5_STRVS
MTATSFKLLDRFNEVSTINEYHVLDFNDRDGVKYVNYKLHIEIDIMPRNMTLSWLQLRIVYCGGSKKCLLRLRLEVSILKRFAGVINVLRGRNGNCYRTLIKRKRTRLVCVVPEYKANNLRFNRNFIFHNGLASHTEMEILHRNNVVMFKSCKVELPESNTVIWRQIQAYKKNISRYFIF